MRVATSVPRQRWLQSEKLAWLDEALANRDNECELFLLPQEFVGGGSCREICKLKGITTDDVPVTPGWLQDNIGALAAKYCRVIGVGATVDREGVFTEDYMFFNTIGENLGHVSKMALPAQDSILTNGASRVTPEDNPDRASVAIEIPELKLRVATVFCWQVFFNHLWNDIKDNKPNLVVNAIKFAPRAWYKKGQNADGENTRIGFAQNGASKKPEDDSLGWIRKLQAESLFKELPIAVTCNTWAGGEQYLALNGFVDEVRNKTKLFHTPSTEEAERVDIFEYDPSLYDELDHLSLGVYAQFKADWQPLMAGTMRRKAIRIEQRARDGRTTTALTKHAEKQKIVKKERLAKEGQQTIFQE